MLPGFVIGKAKVGCDGSRLVRHDEVALFGRPTSVKQTSTISPSRKGRKENEKENKGHVIQQPQTFGHHRRDGTADSLKGEMDTHRQKNKKRGKEAGTRTIEELLQSGRSPKQFRINPLSTLTTPPAHPFLFPNHSIRMHQIYLSIYLSSSSISSSVPSIVSWLLESRAPPIIHHYWLKRWCFSSFFRSYCCCFCPATPSEQ